MNIPNDDILTAARRLRLDNTTPNGPTAAIEMRDPDGRTVRIYQHPANTEPNR